MKNFPHQINQIGKLTEALHVFSELNENGVNLQDDGAVGDAMARRGVYTFRAQPPDIERRLEEEHRKAPSNQGTRTFARDLRRLFTLIGFIASDGLTSTAETLIRQQTDPLDESARQIWSDALFDMAVEDANGNVSHPYRIMLRLVEDIPGLPAFKLGLCLEAQDDSETEYARIKRLAAIETKEQLCQQIGVSPHAARNAVKILPSLARQIGDILETDNGYHLGYAERPDTDAEPSTVEESKLQRRSRQVTSEQITARGSKERSRRSSIRKYDPDAIGKRYSSHESLLAQLVKTLANNVSTVEGYYDLLAVTKDAAILFEVKTIRKDAARQVRTGLGQLLYYEYMLVAPFYPDIDLYRCLVTDRALTTDLANLLAKHNITSLVFQDHEWTAVHAPATLVDLLSL